ncbi:NACHT domain-containing protein [Coleofasciculus sp. E2-BRE-01]|uniref:NACHT domain-containing protein n=1 Tax=Coleofasciculus sp. E2-BRE-01 TaxID=3069524 RepID=UPI0032FC5C60
MVEPGTALSSVGALIVKNLELQQIWLKLQQENLEEYVNDFFQDCLSEGVLLASPHILKNALLEALAEFLTIIEDELLVECGLTEAEVRDTYQVAIGRFIRDDDVKPLLGKAFEKKCRAIDANQLRTIWVQRYSPNMPPGFNWDGVAKQYVKDVRRIVRNSPELEELLELEIQESIEEKVREIAGIPPDFNLPKYQEGLRERYSNLNLSSLDTTGCAYNQLKLWRLFIPQNVRQVHQVLPKIYELPKEHQRRLRESNQLDTDISIEELTEYKQVYAQQPIRPINEIINDKDNYRYLVILGDPGSGKSTLLQYLALDWANSTPNDASLQPIPLLIELRTYMRNRDVGQWKNFLEFFHDSSGIVCHLNQHQLVEQLKAGNALVMFDGLDEVFDPGKREDVMTDIHRFTNDYPDVRVIVTSRVIGYKPQRLQDAQFDHFMLQDLEANQIQEFITRWHDLTFTDQVDKHRKRERLQRAIDTSKAIRELAENPLLLTMMAILNRNQELPRDRPELYNQASRVLLHQWDVERALVEHQQLEIQTIDYKDKQAMLRRVAYQMQAAEKEFAVANLIAADELDQILTDYLKTLDINNPRVIARVMIKQLRERNFILCFMGADYYAFVHRTFLEYFCAWEYVWQFEKERTISLEELKSEVFGKHWWNPSWDEVLCLIIGMIQPKIAGHVIEYLIETPDADEWHTDLSHSKLFFAAKCISEVRNRVDIKETADKMLDRLKGLTDGDDPIEKEEAIRVIATIWKDAPETLNLLKAIAQSDRYCYHDYTQLIAVKGLAENWKNDPDTFLLLMELAKSDENGHVGNAAIQKLLKGWKDKPNFLSDLKTLAQSAKHCRVRETAMREWAQGGFSDPDILPLLKRVAQSNDHWHVRAAALEELARGWKDESGIFEFICDRAVNDPYPLKDETNPLKDETNKTPNPRKTALKIIIKQYPDNPQTLPLLRDRAENDPDEKVREFAQTELAQFEKQKSDI